MTETTQDIIKSKLEAAEALAMALDHNIRDGSIGSVAGVQRFLGTWLDGMRSLMPEEPGKAVKSDEPPIGTRMRDKDGDVWTRIAGGQWAVVDGVYVSEGFDWEYVTRWAPLTEITD
jgi:hypothetical protein